MEQLIHNIKAAIQELEQNDGYLYYLHPDHDDDTYQRKLHEVCLNHRLATYIEKHVIPSVSDNFGKLFVDLEFNKNGNDTKELNVDGEVKCVRPDIIIHNRRHDEEKINYLIVECKKEPCPEQRLRKDYSKIFALMTHHNFMYFFGLQVFYTNDGCIAYLYQRIDGANISTPVEIEK